MRLSRGHSRPRTFIGRVLMDEGLPTQEQRDQFVQELTCSMAAGSEGGFRRFYELYFDRLYRQLLAFTSGNEDLTRDLVQTVLLRVVRYIKVFHNERVLWAWLRQVCRSCYVDWLRRNGHELEPVSITLVGQTLACDGPPDDADEMMELLEKSLDELPNDEREVLRLAYFEDVPHKELALQLHTTPKAIESRLGRIRQKLRKTILERLKAYALF